MKIAVIALNAKFLGNEFESDVQKYLLYLLKRQLDALTESLIAASFTVFGPVVQQGSEINPDPP